MKVKELRQTTKLVKEVLERYSKARNSDDYLYVQVCELVCRQKHISLQGYSFTQFLLHRAENGFPPFESVRRARQKLQAEYPELCGEMDVEAQRELNREAYEDYARSYV